MINKIKLYSNDCPRCKILKQKLDDKKIKYAICNDMDEIMNIAQKNNIMTLPLLKVGNQLMDFTGGIKWIMKM